MSRIHTATLLTALFASTALAAACAHGSGGAGSSPRGPDGGRFDARERRDARPADVVALVLAHGTELSLTSEQTRALNAIAARQDSAVAPLRRRLQAMEIRRPANGARADSAGRFGADTIYFLPPEQWTEGREFTERRDKARQAALRAERAAYRSARDSVFALLQPTQRTRVAQIQADASRDVARQQ